MPVKKIESSNKHQSPATNTNPFDVENYLNANWDRIKNVVDNNADELINLQGDNTANKQDISNIKKEQIVQNENISKLQEENTKLKLENSLLGFQIPTGQASGEYIILNDSSNMPFEEFKIIGKSQQETRSGKNIANLQEYSCSESYSDLNIEINNDEITISTNSLRIATEFVKIPLINLKNATYTFGLDLKSNVENANAQVLIYDSTNKKIVSTIFTNNTTSYVTKTAQVVIDDTVDISNTFIFLYCLGSVGNAYSYSYKNIFFNEGADTEYEKYGVMPSPKFPSEIKNVRNSINFTICNKNLFNEKWLHLGSRYSNATGKVFPTGSEANSTGCLEPISLNKTKKYIAFSTNSSYVQNGVYFYDNNKMFLSRVFPGFGNVATIPDEAYYVAFNISGVNDINDLTNYEWQVEYVDSNYSDSTEYEKHQEQSFTFPLSKGQKLYENSHTSSDGIHYKKLRVVYDGTENWQNAGNGIVLGATCFYVEKPMNVDNVCLCSHFKCFRKANGLFLGNFLNLYISTDTGITTIGDFKIWLSEQKEAGIPLTVEYELAEEVIESYTEEQQEAYNQIQQSCTYKNKTYIFSEDEIVPKFEVKYKKDLETLLNISSSAEVTTNG